MGQRGGQELGDLIGKRLAQELGQANCGRRSLGAAGPAARGRREAGGQRQRRRYAPLGSGARATWAECKYFANCDPLRQPAARCRKPKLSFCQQDATNSSQVQPGARQGCHQDGWAPTGPASTPQHQLRPRLWLLPGHSRQLESLHTSLGKHLRAKTNSTLRGHHQHPSRPLHARLGQL